MAYCIIPRDLVFNWQFCFVEFANDVDLDLCTRDFLDLIGIDAVDNMGSGRRDVEVTDALAGISLLLRQRVHRVKEGTTHRHPYWELGGYAGLV